MGTKKKSSRSARSENETLESAKTVGREAMNQLISLTAEVARAGCQNAETVAGAQVEWLRSLQARSSHSAEAQLKVFGDIGQALLSGSEAYCNELVSFAKASSEEGLATAQHLADSDTVSKWPEIRAEAATRAATLYAHHALALTELARETTAKVSESVKRYTQQKS